MSRTIRHDGAGGDDGVAMITALGIAVLVGLLTVTLITVSMAETRMSGRDRQRSGAVAFAEGQVDTMLARVQGSSPASLPCSGNSSSEAGGVDTFSTTTSVTYYNAAGAVVPCTTGSGPSAQVAKALITSTAASQALAGAAPAERTVETLVNLKPTVQATGLDKAIFGNAGVQLANHGEVFGQNGIPDADVYTNGNFACNNNQNYHGSIFAQGRIDLSSTCTVDVDAWAGTGFTANNTGVTVKGNVKVGSGNASLVRNATVAGRVQVSGAVQGGWRDNNCPAKCTEGATPGMPPAQPFPQLPYDDSVRAKWAAPPPTGGGYTNVESNNDCNVSGDANGPGRWIMDNGPSLAQPTILTTTCKVIIQRNNNTLQLNNNLAVFADQGVSISNSLTIKSSTSAQRSLYFIQPYNAVTSPCNSEGITLDNRVTVESTVDLLMYTPCNIRKANNADHFGQIYAGGNAVVDNSLTMYYRPLPVWGISNQTVVLTGYTLDVLYKRENT